MTDVEIYNAILARCPLYYYTVGFDFEIRETGKIKTVDVESQKLVFYKDGGTITIRFSLLFNTKEALAEHIKNILRVTVGE